MVPPIWLVKNQNRYAHELSNFHPVKEIGDLAIAALLQSKKCQT